MLLVLILKHWKQTLFFVLILSLLFISFVDIFFKIYIRYRFLRYDINLCIWLMHNWNWWNWVLNCLKIRAGYCWFEFFEFNCRLQKTWSLYLFTSLNWLRYLLLDRNRLLWKLLVNRDYNWFLIDLSFTQIRNFIWVFCNLINNHSSFNHTVLKFTNLSRLISNLIIFWFQILGLIIDLLYLLYLFFDLFIINMTYEWRVLYTTPIVILTISFINYCLSSILTPTYKFTP